MGRGIIEKSVEFLTYFSMWISKFVTFWWKSLIFTIRSEPQNSLKLSFFDSNGSKNKLFGTLRGDRFVDRIRWFRVIPGLFSDFDDFGSFWSLWTLSPLFWGPFWRSLPVSFYWRITMNPGDSGFPQKYQKYHQKYHFGGTLKTGKKRALKILQ